MPFKDKERAKLYWKEYHRLRRQIYHKKIGTSDFSQHREINFDDEYKEIEEEYKFLKLLRKPLYSS